MDEVEKIYDQSFDKYYSRYGTIWETWSWEHWPFGPGRSQKVKDRIKELLEQGYRVKCGYAATKIRNVHDRFIFYKPKTKLK